MAEKSRRRNTAIIIALVIIAILLLLLTRCKKPAPQPTPTPTPASTPAATPTPAPSAPAAARPQSDELLTPATLVAPAQTLAGSNIEVQWTGPANPGDYLVITKPDAPASSSGNYKETKDGPTLSLTAPIEPGPYEVRYVTNRSKTILARSPLEVTAATATINAPAQVTLGADFEVKWQGPNNKGDFITIVPKGAADNAFASYVETDKGAAVTLTAPPEAGDCEVRYVTGQARKVLARHPVRITTADITMTAPAEAIAGSSIDVQWTGPNNTGDYITVVAKATPDGDYANYTETRKGSPLKLLMPITPGDAELRYMSGQGRKVLARRAITINAATVTLSAQPEAAPGADVSITWTGPNNTGDYITIVKNGTPDGQYAAYTNTTKGSPLTVKAPKDAGEAEIRYCAGQGNKVLARIPLTIKP